MRVGAVRPLPRSGTPEHRRAAVGQAGAASGGVGAVGVGAGRDGQIIALETMQTTNPTTMRSKKVDMWPTCMFDMTMPPLHAVRFFGGRGLARGAYADPRLHQNRRPARFNRGAEMDQSDEDEEEEAAVRPPLAQAQTDIRRRGRRGRRRRIGRRRRRRRRAALFGDRSDRPAAALRRGVAPPGDAPHDMDDESDDDAGRLHDMEDDDDFGPKSRRPDVRPLRRRLRGDNDHSRLLKEFERRVTSSIECFQEAIADAARPAPLQKWPQTCSRRRWALKQRWIYSPETTVDEMITVKMAFGIDPDTNHDIENKMHKVHKYTIGCLHQMCHIKNLCDGRRRGRARQDFDLVIALVTRYHRVLISYTRPHGPRSPEAGAARELDMSNFTFETAEDMELDKTRAVYEYVLRDARDPVAAARRRLRRSASSCRYPYACESARRTTTTA